MKRELMSRLLPIALVLSIYCTVGFHEERMGVGLQFAQVGDAYQSDRIPLSLLPPKTSLHPGDYVIISVSDIWSSSDLNWRIGSSILDPGYLSDNRGPTVVYTAPNDIGEVVIRVQGTMGGVR